MVRRKPNCSWIRWVLISICPIRAMMWRRLGVDPFDPMAIIAKRPFQSGRMDVNTGRSKSSGTFRASDWRRS